MKSYLHISMISYLLAAAFLMIAFSAAPATVVYVDAGATGSNNGTSWTDAYTDLQNALGSAVPGDSIWVAEGTYMPTTGSDRTATFQLMSGVKIYGGFAGTETMLSERDWLVHVTILSGDIGVTADSTDNSYHVVTGTGTDSTAVLDGFTVTRGIADAASPHNNGAGMIIESGGAGGRVTVANVIFSKNSAGSSSTNGEGGGMYNRGQPTLNNVSFQNNWARSNGGGLYDQGQPTLNVLSFSNNQAIDGGGIYSRFSILTLSHADFSDNEAVYGGGMFIWDSPTVTLTDISFSSNEATSNGGGIYILGGDDISLTNVIFDNNYVRDAYSPWEGGGGMCLDVSSPTLINVTFVDNATTWGAGGGILNMEFSSPILVNTILWQNWADTGDQIYNQEYTDPTISYSLIEFCGGSGPGWDTALGIDGGHNIEDYPMFKGSSLPSAPLSVWSSSPAVDAGNSAAVPLGVTTDIDGNPRIVGTVDMGAYEHPGVPTGIDDGIEGGVPAVTRLRSVYPNPFNPSVAVEFDVDRLRHVSIAIYDLVGRRVKTLINEIREPGVHRVVWRGLNESGNRVATGVYFLRFQSEGHTAHRKLVMLK